MDEVELAIPAVVGMSKLTRTEGFNSGAGSGDVGEVRQPAAAASILIKPSIKACSSLVSKKEPLLWKKMPGTDNCSRVRQSSNFHERDSKGINFGSTKTSIQLITGLEATQLQKKSSKVARTSTVCSKRSRTAQMEISMSESVAEDGEGSYTEPAKGDVSEKSHMPKQKNNSNCKRGDKRNGKAPKSRGDSFCLKDGLVSFSSAAGGNNFLGVCSSKTDLYDVTKNAAELSVNELLDGSYKCHIYAKDEGKEVTNTEDGFLHSVRKAWSILRLEKCVGPKNNGEVDSCKHNASAGSFISGFASSNINDCDKGDALAADMSSTHKVQECGENHIKPVIMDWSLLHQPKEVLERLLLPPPKDFDSLLLDAAKPALSSRSSADIRLGKPVSNRTGLPPFPWSHSSVAHCKSGPDAGGKVSSAKNTCQGRWVRVENSIARSGDSTDFLESLASLTSAQSSVPSEIVRPPSTSISFPSSNQVLSSSAGGSTSHGHSEEHTPTVLAAAQTLYEIGITSKKLNPDGTIKWLKKPSERIMKTSKTKANEKTEHEFMETNSTARPDHFAKDDVMFPSKKLKFSVDVKFTDINHANAARKVPINGSAPRSIRSSPNKFTKESTLEPRNLNTNVVNKSCMMPPPPRIIDKVCSSQPKPRKVATMDLNRSGSKLN